MIEATAQENKRALEDRRAPQSEDGTVLLAGTADPGDGLPNHQRRSRHLILSIAGLIVASTVGGFIFASKGSEKQSSTLPADSILVRKPPVASDTTGEPMTRHLASGAVGSGTVGVEEMWTGIGTAGVAAAPSDDPTVATPPAGQPTEKPGSDAEPPPGEDAAGGQTPAEALPSDPIAPATDMASKQPLPPQAPLPPLTGSEIGSTVDPAKDHPVAIPIASTISDVRMRAGPGNGQAVLATIPKGRPVEVIECRQWCEVIFAGQRGWVYKSFIGPPSIARRP